MNQLSRESDVLHIGSLTLPISDIVLVGEATTQDGPFADDWFLVLVHRDGRWIELSLYDEAKSLHQQLSTALGCPLPLGLANSTDFASRIIWPLTLTDRPVFTYERVRDRSFLRSLRMCFIPEMAHHLSPEARSTVTPPA